MNGTELGKITDTRLVYGFEDAGKTTYIQECVRDDRFYKRGSTLILCFEKGDKDLDVSLLTERNASVVYYDGGDIRSFCEESIQKHSPDRIYVEMNSDIPDLKDQFPECMKVTFAITLIDWDTFQLYYAASLQTLRQMVAASHQVVFRGCPSRRILEPYSQAFRLMNPKASYLRQDPMGYHEKAFDLFLPFSLDVPEIDIDKKNYLAFWLDSFDNPEHYDGKKIRFTDPLEIRKSGPDGRYSCGRVVMTCCMADLQFMCFELDNNDGQIETNDDPALIEGWFTMDAFAKTVTDVYGQKKIRLVPKAVRKVQAPEELIMDSRR